MQDIVLKKIISDYTEAEFILLLKEFRNHTRQNKELKGKALDSYLDRLAETFARITEHPRDIGLIAYPEHPGDDEPERVIEIVKEWRKSQGLPLFKDSK